MSDLERYDPDYMCDRGRMFGVADGDYVAWDDAKQLLERIAELEAREAALVEALRAFVNNSSAQVNLPLECEIAEAALAPPQEKE